MSRQLRSFLQINLSGPLSRLVRHTAPVSIGLLLIPIAAHAQAGGTPFDTGFTALQTLFTGTVAKVASVVAIVFGGYGLSPYSARIEFEKVYTNPADHTELKRERWTASVTYVFREIVKNYELAVNPLGLTIVRFRADQAFD